MRNITAFSFGGGIGIAQGDGDEGTMGIVGRAEEEEGGSGGRGRRRRDGDDSVDAGEWWKKR